MTIEATPRVNRVARADWGATEFTDCQAPTLEIQQLRLGGPQCRISGAVFGGLTIDRVRAAAGACIIFSHCRFDGDVRLRGLTGLEGVIFSNCHVQGSLSFHDFDGALDARSRIDLHDCSVQHQVLISSVSVGRISLEATRAWALNMDQSEARERLAVARRCVIEAASRLSVAQGAQVRIDDSDLMGRVKVSLGGGARLEVSEGRIQHLDVGPRGPDSRGAALRVKDSTIETLVVSGLREVGEVALVDSAFPREVRLDVESYAADSRIEITGVKDWGALALQGPEPPEMALSGAPPSQCALDPRVAETLKRRTRRTLAPEISGLLEQHFSKLHAFGDLDDVQYRHNLNMARARLGAARRPGPWLGRALALFLKGYVYGYGVRLTNQLLTLAGLTLLVGGLAILGRHDQTAWFFKAQAAGRPALELAASMLLLVAVGPGGPWGAGTPLSVPALVVIEVLRVVAFLTLSATIIRKIART